MVKWRPKSIFSKLLWAHLLVVLATLIVVNFFFSYLVERYLFSAQEWELSSQGIKVAEVLGEELKTGSEEEVRKLAEALAASMDIKIRVIDPELDPEDRQIIVATPEEEEEETKIGLQENEVEHVLKGNSLSKKVFGPDMKRLLLAIPIFSEENPDPDNPEESEVISAITVSAPLAGVEATIAQISRFTLYSGLLAAAIAGVLAFSLSNTISRPLRNMTRAAQELVKGNFRSRINVQTSGEMKELAGTFNQAVDEIEKTIEEQKRLQKFRQNLVANVSHEFRAPLTSIQGYVEAILEGFGAEKEKERYLEIVLDNTLYINRLVNDLLELSSIESGYIQLQWQKIPAASFLNKVLHSIHPKAQSKNIEINLECTPELAYIWGDEDRLYQVMINLLENAVINTHPGGKVDVTAARNKNWTVLTVSDNGPGIPPGDIPHIWERFYKVDKARSKSPKGKGLGLAIVKELVGLHRGKVSVKSTPGKGSTFYVFLPHG